MTSTDRPLSILHTEASCGWGGQELRILTESQAMLALGHQVHLVADPSSRIAARAADYGLEVTRLAVEHKTLKGLLAMRQFLASRRFDIINTHSSTDSWLVALAAATLRAAPPMVRTRHISAPFKNNALTRWNYNRASAAVVTTGEALRLDMIKTLGTPASQVISIPTGIDTATFCPAPDPVVRSAFRASLGLPTDRLLVGIVATLRSWKGHADLIDALAGLDASGPASHWHLVIVGDGPQRDNLIAQTAALGLQDRITLAGHQNEPAPWFRSLDIFCLPSYANEGVPQALMQAMACGLPCVTTTAGAITEAISNDETGIVITPRDVTNLRASIERLAAQPALAARLGSAARERALDRFGRERMVQRMLRVFRGVIGGTAIDSPQDPA